MAGPRAIPNASPLTYSWTFTSRPAGSAAALTNATTVNPTFTPDAAGNFVVQLIVRDGALNSPADSVTIAATAANLAPVANAGPDQAVNVGQQVTLTGSASSDPERQSLTYSWSFVSRPAGSAAALTNATTVNPTFTPDAAGNFVVQLIVRDGALNSPADSVTIAATAANLAPVANAGPDQAVNVGQQVTLTGSASSDPERQSLTYSWSFVSRPAGSAAALTNATTVNPTFTPDAAGNFVVQLIVRDGALNSPADSVIIAATAANLRPTANAGSNQAVNVGQQVTLNGSASSDPERQSLTYSWSFVSRPAGSAAALTNATTVNPTFTPDAAGQYVVGLVVGDGMLNSTNTANVTITVNAPTPVNRAPSVTNPGNKTVTAGQPLSFTISGSDPDAGNTLRFAATGLPSGASLNATTGAFSWTPTTAQASATPYSVTVTATDNGTPPLTSAAQTFTITVQAVVTAPPPTTNQPPTVTNPGNRTVTAGSPLSFMITGTDPNVGQTRTFSAGTTLPAGATLSASGAFAWTPTTAQASATPYSVTVTATDNGTPALTSAPQTLHHHGAGGRRTATSDWRRGAEHQQLQGHRGGSRRRAGPRPARRSDTPGRRTRVRLPTWWASRME